MNVASKNNNEITHVYAHKNKNTRQKQGKKTEDMSFRVLLRPERRFMAAVGICPRLNSHPVLC